MKADKCFECDGCVDLHDHHVIPKCLGGTRTIKLCAKCHGLVHDRNFLNHKKLQAAGIANAKKSGVKFGRPTLITPDNESEFIQDLFFGITSTTKLAIKYGFSEPTVRRLKVKYYEKNKV